MTREEALKVAKPILFNTEMVRAILNEKKTATRRLVRPRSKNACGFYVTFRKSDNAFMGVYDYDENERQFDSSQTLPCQAGDILYVRETWTYHEGAADGIIYKARCPEKLAESKKWHPSIHMPKEAARIFLRVTNVRVERLQEMDTEDDKNYIAEGARDKHDFIRIWDSTVKDRELYGWYANPWVWVIEFERLEMG